MTDILFKKISEYAKKIGFDEVKVAKFEDFNFYTNNFRDFLKNEYHGEMSWMKEKSFMRENPKNIWNEAKSAIVLGLNYGPSKNPIEEISNTSKGYISVYARRKDYHKTIKSKLKDLGRYITNISDLKIKVFVDTAPIMEKPLAEISSLGWIGKHTNLVSRKFGSWLLLGIILTNHNFKKSTEKASNSCGSCNACNIACPTNAFVSQFKLDARKCISYLTIEHKTHIAMEYRKAIGNRIFGCDDCLAVCPWNKFAKKHSEAKLNIKQNLVMPPLKFLIKMEEEEFRSSFSGTPLRRLSYVRFLRNILIAIGNSGDQSLVSEILIKLDNNNSLVRAMAIWALSKLSKDDFKKEKKRRYDLEKDTYVKNEWKLDIDNDCM